MSLAIVGLATTQTIRARARSDRERVLNQLVESAERAEREGRAGEALYEVEAALSQARTLESLDPTRLTDLLERRDRISSREARIRLAGIDHLTPDQAVGEAMTLDARAELDRALEPLASEIASKLRSSRIRQARADEAAARWALEHGKPAEAFQLAARLHERASSLDGSDSRSFQETATTLIETIVAKYGVALPTPTGRFLVGSAEAYEISLERPWTDTLRAHGYLVSPRNSPWRPVWDEHAPFRATTSLVETQDGFYYQSKNRTTQVDAILELTREGQSIWQTRVVARTRVPLPDLPAYLAGHLATASKRDPDIEKRLQADAVALFVEQAAFKLKAIPAWKP
jgi:hypothetical protein